MKKPLLLLSALTLSLNAMIMPISAQAALPVAVNGEQVPSLAPMLQKITPAVVTIAVKGKQATRVQIPEQFKYFFGPGQFAQERPFQGLGSGVIIDAKKGYIVTNYHVIDGADEIKVQLSDGRELKAEVLGGDRLSDIALIKLDKAKNLTQVTLADSDKLEVGDFAVAIGNPFGVGQTVTSGIISALGRSGLNLENFENFIQTDAAINSGNSGGALVNLNGELIGINTAILGPNGGNVGIGFAIPANMVKNLSQQIIEFGEVKRGILGVKGGEVTAELAEAMGYKNSRGAFVSEVIQDGAAEKAGVKAGDVITSVNGKEIHTFGELRAKIASLGAGKEVKLGLIRDGKETNVEVTLGESESMVTTADDLHTGLKGAKLSNTTDKDPVQGVKIVSVEKDSEADRYQLQKGDIIIGINRTRVTSLKQAKEILEAKEGVVALNIQRKNSSLYLVLR